MTYHVLARKWRPQTFSDLVGQTHVVKALTYALSHNQVHHAYLFTGTRGVGKTSIARIFAKSLNCEVNGVSANPCGTCDSCTEIVAGRFVDLIEVDAASRTGVDETRELIDSVTYLPTKGRYKVYLIDEVHMFSKSSFNALLKTLEEPPEHVKFILATTDPEKLPITILSRCLQFNLKSLPQIQVAQHLANICQTESIQYDEEALRLLANAGDGSMRDTLSMTDQAIAYGQGQLSLRAVTEILGTIQPADIEAILFSIATNNPNQLSTALHRLDDYEVDARAFLIEIMKRLQRMAWAKEGIVDNLSDALLSTVNDIPKPLLHLWYDIAAKALPNLAIAGEPREVVEMTLLRMLAFTPSDWLPRHRTLFHTEPNQESGSNDESANLSGNPEQHSSAPIGSEAELETINENELPTNQTMDEMPPSEGSVTTPNPIHAAEFTSSQVGEEPAIEFAEQVHAAPIVAQDSLAAAEERFFSNTAVSDVEMAPSSMTQELDSAPIETAEKETPLTSIEPVSAVEPSVIASNVDENSWHLGSEAVDVTPAPSMDEINAMMQRGRDISAPMPEANSSMETAEVMPQAISEPQPALEALDVPVVDVPPWETLPESPSMESVPSSPSAEPVASVAVQTDTPLSTPSETNTDTINVTSQPTVVAEPVSVAEGLVEKCQTFDWYQMVNALSLSQFTHHAVSLGLLQVEPMNDNTGVLATLAMRPQNEVMLTPECLQELQSALQAHFTTPIKLESRIADIQVQTPAERAQLQAESNRSDLVTRFSEHPITQRIVNELGGEILPQTIKPVAND